LRGQGSGFSIKAEDARTLKKLMTSSRREVLLLRTGLKSKRISSDLFIADKEEGEDEGVKYFELTPKAGKSRDAEGILKVCAWGNKKRKKLNSREMHDLVRKKRGK